MNINEFEKLPIMGILRDIPLSCLEPLLETIIQSGLKTIEIALNTDNAIELIKRAVKIANGKISIGAGTVLSRQDVKRAIDAGVEFIVTPVLIEEVFLFCRENKIPFFPGALTPTEVYNAWQYNPIMVKVFPASFFGPPYFKALKGPFKDIKLMAVGGVTVENIVDYFRNGADAVAFGASIFKEEWIEQGNFGLIRDKIISLISLIGDNK